MKKNKSIKNPPNRALMNKEELLKLIIVLSAIIQQS